MIIQWTQKAENQLDTIYDFIKVESEISAYRIYNQILDEVELLTEYPNSEVIYIVAVFDCRQIPTN